MMRRRNDGVRVLRQQSAVMEHGFQHSYIVGFNGVYFVSLVSLFERSTAISHMAYDVRHIPQRC